MRTALSMRGILVAACLATAYASPAYADYVAPDMHHAPYGDIKVVVPITSDDASFWLFRLRNIANGMRETRAGSGSMQAKVVLYGPGVKMLLQPLDAKLKEAVDAARSAGVQFNICNVTLKGMNLDWHKLYGVQEADIVPSGFAEVGWLATQGWVVDAAN